MNISGTGSCQRSQGGHQAGGLDRFVAKLADDDSAEAKAVKEAYEKVKSASGTEETKAAKAELREAMHAFREANPPEGGEGPKGPPPPPQDGQGPGGFLQQIADALATDDSEETTSLKAALDKLQEDPSDANKQSVFTALDALFQKLQAQGAGYEPGSFFSAAG